MGKLFIDEVRGIVLDNLSNESFGTKELASQLGLSTSQTLRKVKAAAGKSINQYIRELRLEKAAKLINKTDDTIAEISYKVGFSSPSYFNKAFSKYYGIAPGEYKTKSLKLSDLSATSTEAEPRSSFLSKRFIYAIGLVLITIIGFVVINNFSIKKRALPNSIAVLPFKDLSPEDTQWFCDGVSDNILHALAQMKDLSVTSFTSSSTYRNSDKQIPQIAKELGVSYVLEGSVVLHNGKIKVIAQLIDANDQHVWSKEYNESFDDVITVQNNVAREVMGQLEITLSSAEVETLSKYPTENMEAYNLYMEGRRINQSRKYEDLVKNMVNNQKAIALDSNFVEAYVDLAATKMVVAIEGYTYAYSATEALRYINKALSIDPNSARANAVKARLLLGNDWSDSEKYFKKAIALNPNDAESRYWYADYFLKAKKTDLKEALKQISIANRLSPFSSVIATRYAWTLILNEKFEEAEAYMKNYGFLITPDNNFIFKALAMARKNKDYQPVLDWAFAKLDAEPENAAFWCFWISIGYDQVFIDKEKVKEYSKKAYELNPDYLEHYFLMLVENGFFNDAEQIIKNKSFKTLEGRLSERLLWYYYYNKKDTIKALSIINKNPEHYVFGYRDISRTYALLGDRVKLDSIDKLYFSQGEDKYFDKAFVYAILKERDSMYYYLNKIKYTYNFSISLVNGSPEFDPYRKDERYKALLRAYYLPKDGEQYIPKVEE